MNNDVVLFPLDSDEDCSGMIQNAISEASAGDAVLLNAGVYNLKTPLMLNRSITLMTSGLVIKVV